MTCQSTRGVALTVTSHEAKEIAKKKGGREGDEVNEDVAEGGIGGVRWERGVDCEGRVLVKPPWLTSTPPPTSNLGRVIRYTMHPTMDPIIGAVAQVLVQQLLKSLGNEYLTLHAFKDEFEKMKNKIRTMTCVLTDSQRLRGTDQNETTVKGILAQLRDLVYDADDVVLDCQTRAAYEKISILGGYTPRGVSFRRRVTNTLKQINMRIADMENELRTYVGPVNSIIQNYEKGSSQGSINSSRHTSHVLGPEKIIGLNEDTEKIITYITRNENSSSIGIVGMGGLGKTTIAQKVYNHKRVIDHFDIRIWVSVTQKFRPEDILTSMLKQLPIDDSVQDEMLQIQQNLKNKKYLIVMDDVWDTDPKDRDWWRKLSPYLPEGEKSKKSIIVTSRNEDYAKKMEATSIHHARELNGEESWSLFSEVAFHRKKSKGEDPEFQELGKVIVQKCNGLPLAIKTVAGLLASKETPREWRDVKDNFHEVLATNTSVWVILQMSYDDLPALLKHCLLSFSIYPEDCEINAEQLIYWWVGEGFVHGNGKKTAIEEASQCLSELVNRCLVGVVKRRGYDGRVYKCKMHDMVRDLIIKMSKEETFSSFDVRNKQCPDINSRHLGYASGMEEELLENNSKLRAFLLMENCVLPSLQGTGLATVKSLRVLDLSQNEEESLNVDDLMRWLKYQKRLAYLNLRKLRGLTDLPNWIRKRQNLQILIIKECKQLKRLPFCITTLQNLMVLDVDNCSLENLTQGLGKLTKLQVLSGFKLGPGKDGARLCDLKGLKELRVLGIQLTKMDGTLDETEDMLLELKELKVLSIDTKDCGDKQIAFVEKLVPPPSLRELYLRSYQGKTTPGWVTPPRLPELEYFYIDDSPISSMNTNFWVSDGKPWKIEGLCFMHLPRLQMKWEDAEKSMKYLRYLEISHCHGLQGFPIDVNKYDIWVKEEFELGFQNQEGKVSTQASTSSVDTESQ